MVIVVLVRSQANGPPAGTLVLSLLSCEELQENISQETTVFECDIFRVDPEGVRWLETASSFDHAHRRIHEIGAHAPGDYVILDTGSGRQSFITVPKPQFASWSPAQIAAAETVLDVAMTLSRADFGNLQLADRALPALTIVAHCNLSQKFLTFFHTVHSHGAACGAAMAKAQRVIISNVAADPVYNDDSRQVMLAERIQSLQSVPLIVNSKIVGVLSTHYRQSNTPLNLHFRISDDLATSFARQIASLPCLP